MMPADTETSLALDVRGRPSREYCTRRSFTTDGLRILVSCPTTLWVLSPSVPLFESALVVSGVRLVPVDTAFSAVFLR